MALALVKHIPKLSEVNRGNANGVMNEFKKDDEPMRARLFVLQVWRKYDQETAEKLARRKAGEFLDPELAKVF